MITRTWTATDGCGNASSCIQTITVVDLVAPVITCPASLTIACTADNSPAGTGVATAVDDCSGATISHSDATAAGSCAGNYVISRTWTDTDGCGNASSCVQTITVVDLVAPVITCPASLTIDCTDDNSPTGTGNATAVDACSGVATIISSDVISILFFA